MPSFTSSVPLLLKIDMTKHEHSGWVFAIQFGIIVAGLTCTAIVSELFMSKQNDTSNDTTAISAACVGVSAVIAVMPLQLAPLLADKGTERFRILVRCGIFMCFGSLCFIAATILKFGFIQYSKDATKNELVTNVCNYSSSAFFLIAVAATVFGFFKFATELAHECFCQTSEA
jgi:hypothetical protein